MRVLFLLVVLAGAALGIFYPWAAINLVGHDIGSWRIYDRATGSTKADAQLVAADAPVRVLLDLRVVGGTARPGAQTMFTVTVQTGGRTVLITPLTFADATLTHRSPHTNERIYRDDAGLISNITDGTYSFSMLPGDVTGIHIQSVDIVLRAGALSVNEVVRACGLLLMAAGVVGLIAAIRRHRRIRWEGAPLTPPRDLDDGNRE